jgi:hypothetical protein
MLMFALFWSDLNVAGRFEGEPSIRRISVVWFIRRACGRIGVQCSGGGDETILDTLRADRATIGVSPPANRAAVIIDGL